MNELPTPIYQFRDFGKMSRLSREMVVTEKIDGTNAQIAVVPEIEVPTGNTDFTLITGGQAIFAGSRNRWITPQADNYGFARWVYDHAEELLQLGPGRHFGEWWGKGIQRGYDVPDKRLSLFNVSRFTLHGYEPRVIAQANPKAEPKMTTVLPPCVGLVPVLYRGVFSTEIVETVVSQLRVNGSCAAPGFMRPEGVVVYHTAQGALFKKTLEKDETPKSLQ